MSYIVTSSEQQQYGGLSGSTHNPTRTQIGVENPAQYTNHFKSPLVIEQDSEIAVESVKISRAPVFNIEDNSLFYTYWGVEQSNVVSKEARNSMPIPCRPDRGSYSDIDFTTELLDKLNTQYVNPEIFGSYNVVRTSNASGQFSGFSLGITQRGSASTAGFPKNKSDSVFMTTQANWKNPKNISASSASVTVAISGTSTRITRVTATGASLLDDEHGELMLGGLPVCLVEGRAEFLTENASTTGWRCGLSRPQTEYKAGSLTIVQHGASGITRNLKPGGTDNHATGGPGNQYMKQNPVTLRNQRDFYDYMVEDDGANIYVYHSTYDEENQQFVMSEVKYYNPANADFKVQLTSAAFNASYDRVRFRTLGDEVVVDFGETGKPALYKLAVASTISDVKWRCFVPIGENRASLYPKVTIAGATEYIDVQQYDSQYNGTDYHEYPNYDTSGVAPVLTTGDSFYVNNRIGRGFPDHMPFAKDNRDRPYCLSQTRINDRKTAYRVDPAFLSADTQTFAGLLAGAPSVGLNYDHVWIINSVAAGGNGDYLEGKYSTAENSAEANFSRMLGFGSKSLLLETSTAGYVGGAGTDAITFNSFSIPEYRVHSAFVRISNLQHNSYNGAKQSTSKILYHVPRFTNEGRDFGDLYFVPGEKTYLKLNNTAPIMLNNLSVEIVDVNEQPVTDLNNNTIVCFHVKPRK